MIFCFLLYKGADAAAVDAHGNTPVGLVGKDERPATPQGSTSSSEDDGEYEEYDEYEDDGEEE